MPAARRRRRRDEPGLRLRPRRVGALPRVPRRPPPGPLEAPGHRGFAPRHPPGRLGRRVDPRRPRPLRRRGRPRAARRRDPQRPGTPRRPLPGGEPSMKIWILIFSAALFVGGTCLGVALPPRRAPVPPAAPPAPQPTWTRPSGYPSFSVSRFTAELHLSDEQ